MLVLADCEANGLNPDKLHCVSVKELNKGKVTRFTDSTEFWKWVNSRKITKWFFHNGLNYDVPVLNNLVSPTLIDPKDVVDTQVVSKLVNYQKFQTHSLRELGEYLGVYKGDYEGGWEKYTEEMGEYCDQDVLVLEAIVNHYWKYLTDPSWIDSMRLEHDIAILCREMSDNGFLFDVPKAQGLLKNVKAEMSDLESSFRDAFGTRREELKRCKHRVKNDGSLYGNVKKDFETYDDIEIDGEEYVVYHQVEFNPGSPKERIDALWDAGWKPTDKTKGHLKAIKEARGARR